MTDCPHGDAAHWPGDAGDVVDSLTNQAIRTGTRHLHAAYAYTPTVVWLRNLGAIQ